jgi:hypothetical protein
VNKNHEFSTGFCIYSVAFSPQANYTDWAIATCRRNLVPTFADRGGSRGQRGGSPTVVNLSFLDRLFVHKRIISAVKRVAFVSDRMSYIILRGRWFHIIVLNVHTPTEHKTDDVKDTVYQELVRVFDEFLKGRMKILL